MSTATEMKPRVVEMVGLGWVFSEAMREIGREDNIDLGYFTDFCEHFMNAEDVSFGDACDYCYLNEDDTRERGGTFIPTPMLERALSEWFYDVYEVTDKELVVLNKYKWVDLEDQQLYK